MNTELNNSFTDEMSCVGFACCFFHRLELALKDALSELLNPIAANKSSKNRRN